MLDNQNLTDSNIVMLLKRQDRDAYTTALNRYWALLFCHAKKMLTDDEPARMVVQIVFKKLWNEKSITGTLSDYLYTSIRLEVVNAIRYNPTLKAKCIDSLMAFTEPEGKDLNEEKIMKKLSNHIEGAIENLPKNIRDKFELRNQKTDSANPGD